MTWRNRSSSTGSARSSARAPAPRAELQASSAGLRALRAVSGGGIHGLDHRLRRRPIREPHQVFRTTASCAWNWSCPLRPTGRTSPAIQPADFRPEIEARTLELGASSTEPREARIDSAIRCLAQRRLYVIHITDAHDDSGDSIPAAAMLQSHGEHIARIVRGESVALSESERDEALTARISYYPATCW